MGIDLAVRLPAKTTDSLTIPPLPPLTDNTGISISMHGYRGQRRPYVLQKLDRLLNRFDDRGS